MVCVCRERSVRDEMENEKARNEGREGGRREDSLFCESQSPTLNTRLPPLLAASAHSFFWLSQARSAAEEKSVCEGFSRVLC